MGITHMKNYMQRAKEKVKAKCVGIEERKDISNGNARKEMIATLWQHPKARAKARARKASKARVITKEGMAKAKAIGSDHLEKQPEKEA